MKKSFTYILLLVVLFIMLFRIEASAKDYYNFYTGAYVTTSLAVNTLKTEGFKNQATYVGLDDIGLSFFLWHRSHLGLNLNLAYSSNGFANYPYDLVDEVYTYKFHSIAINPMIYLGGFLIGINYAIPTGGNVTILDSRGNNPKTYDIKSSDINSVWELRVGGLIPLLDENDMRFNLNIMAGYCLSKFQTNTQLASFSMGISFYYKAFGF